MKKETPNKNPFETEVPNDEWFRKNIKMVKALYPGTVLESELEEILRKEKKLEDIINKKHIVKENKSD